MKSSIKEILGSVELLQVIEKSSTISLESFVSDANDFYQKGKAGKLNNAPQMPYFAIHLACLKNSVLLDASYLMKRSGLTPKSYQSSLFGLFRLVQQEILIVSARSIASYYLCPSLEGMINVLLKGSRRLDNKLNKDDDPCLILAAAIQILEGAKRKVGRLPELALLWAQHPEDLKAANSLLKPLLPKASLPIDYAKILATEIKINESKQRLAAAAAQQQQDNETVITVDKTTNKKTKTTPTTNTRSPSFNDSSNGKVVFDISHPLITFICTSNGPAFGPIIF